MMTEYDPAEIARQTSKILLETKSILFNADQPFTYTSGRVGPVYIDCRRLISFPEARNTLMNYATQMIADTVGLDNLDVIAGGETAGIPYAAFLAERMNKPMVYVRKKAKGFGRTAQIEGHIDEGARVLLCEDLQNFGHSKKIFIDALRAAETVVEHFFVLFNYGIHKDTAKIDADMGITLHCLSDWPRTLDLVKQEGYFDANTVKQVEAFFAEPLAWSQAHGGKVEESA